MRCWFSGRKPVRQADLAQEAQVGLVPQGFVSQLFILQLLSYPARTRTWNEGTKIPSVTNYTTG